MRSRCPLVVFSDLDGTLLDHESYSWEAAKPALHRLAMIGVPIILSSSKTAAEIAVLQKEMGLTAYPAIVENGAGVIGMEQADATAEQYTALRAALDRLPDALRRNFRGFGDMTAQELADTTRLNQDAAALAKQRAFSEPGIWYGSQAEQADFIKALTQLGITARQGGRFLTLSFGKTKADRMADIIAHYRPALTVALGDAPNDTEMLEAADFGIIIANPHRHPLPSLDAEATGRIFRTTEAGPKGWNSAIQDLLDRLELTKGQDTHG